MASSAKQRLIDWANAQESWVRALVAEALATGKPLTGAALDRLYAQLLVEKGLATGEPREAPPLAAPSRAPATAADALALVRLSGVHGVNALAEGQDISFGPKLTVLYGENAAGKSGYVRILKRLAGVRAAEAVLGDFRGDGTGAPRATVEYALGGQPHVLQWSNEAGIAPFDRLSVFDTRAVSLHVDEDLTYVFTPADVALYRHVHEALGAVRARLDAQVAEARPKVNPFVTAFARDAVVFPKLEALGASTSLDELRALAADEGERIEALREQLAALKPDSAKARLQAALAESELHGSLAALAGVLRRFDVQGYAAAAERVKQAEAAREAAVDEAFSDAEIAGSNLPSWRAFLEAAQRFLDDVGEKTYPSRGDDCVYCRQPLKPAAVTLVKRYRQHIKDGSQRELDDATEDLEARTQQLSRLPIAQVLTLVARRVEALDTVPVLLTRAVTLLDLATKLQATGATDAVELARVAAEVEAGAAAEKKAADAQLAALKKEGSARQQEHDALQAELLTLENRRALLHRLAEVDAYVSQAKWAAAGAAVSGRISQVMRSLTEQSKAANEEVLNLDFERLFLDECARLKAPPVEVDFAGKKGQAARRKALASASHALSDVLSEGEQKVIALADFLAEARLRPSAAPMVFDDPVTSLDHKRTGYVVERIGELCEHRQVVVFTHDTAFARALVRRVPGARLYEVTASGGSPGRVSPLPPEALPPGA